MHVPPFQAGEKSRCRYIRTVVPVLDWTGLIAAFVLHWGSFPIQPFRFKVPVSFRRNSFFPSVRQFSCTSGPGGDCGVCMYFLSMCVCACVCGCVYGCIRVWVEGGLRVCSLVDGPVGVEVGLGLGLGLLLLHTCPSMKKSIQQ